jgi:hypothetical protein
MLPPSSSLTSHPWRSLIGCALAAWAVSAALPGRALAVTQTSDLHRDEEIVFFPSLAHRVRGRVGWECEIRGCVYPQQIARILIRDATGEPPGSERYQTAFRGLPPGLWQVFRAAVDIFDSCPPHPGG